VLLKDIPRFPWGVVFQFLVEEDLPILPAAPHTRTMSRSPAKLVRPGRICHHLLVTEAPVQVMRLWQTGSSLPGWVLSCNPLGKYRKSDPNLTFHMLQVGAVIWENSVGQKYVSWLSQTSANPGFLG
jgi:hypothetical protein